MSMAVDYTPEELARITWVMELNYVQMNRDPKPRYTHQLVSCPGNPMKLWVSLNELSDNIFGWQAEGEWLVCEWAPD